MSILAYQYYFTLIYTRKKNNFGKKSGLSGNLA